MSDIPLTEGVLARIMQGGQIENPIVQVLCCQKIQSGADGNDRYRLMLSDGKYMYSMVTFAVQANHHAGAGPISNNTIIVIKRYIINTVHAPNKNENPRILIILDLEVLAPGEDVAIKIGNPRKLTHEEIVAEPSSSTVQMETNETVNTPRVAHNNNFLGNNNTASTSTSAATNANLSARRCCPIECITPYMSRWTLKARVTSKGPIRTWSNAKGTGKLFNMDLCDETGEIRVTAFRDEVDRFYDMIQVDKVYYISGGQVKLAKYSTLKNDYEIALSQDTQISECVEGIESLPKLSFKFIPIAQLATMESNSVFDVIGVCKETTELMTFQSRAGRPLKKRDVTLVDQSRVSINLPLWSVEAEQFDGSTKPIIAIKGGRIRDFMGAKSISMGDNSIMRINPDIPEAHQLRDWFDSQVDNLETANLSVRSGNVADENVQLMSIRSVKAQQLRNDDKLDFTVLGTIVLIKADNCVYIACPQEQCSKKVVDMSNNTYRCEKCGRTYDTFKYRLLMNVKIADHTDSVWTTVFSNDAEKILGKTSQEIGEWLRDDRIGATEYIAKQNFKQYMFKCRAKMETFNAEARLRVVILAAESVNYSVLHKYYSRQIASLCGI